MRGRWISFDTAATNAELSSIPQPDRGALYYAMERYGQGVEIGWVLKDYGNGLLMLKAKGQKRGRCLFFTIDSEDPNLFVALLFYKKESQDAPDHLIEAARQRRGRYLSKGKKEE